MKSLQRYCCALLCCLLFLGVFSVSASAEDIKDYSIYHYHKFPSASTVSGSGLTFVPNNGKEEKKETTYQHNSFLTGSSYSSVYRLENTNKDILFSGGNKVKVKFNNVYFSLLVTDVYANADYTGTEQEHTYFDVPTGAHVVVAYTDGSQKTYYDGVTFTHKNNTKVCNIEFNFTPDKDVSQLSFYLKTDLQNTTTHDSQHQYYKLTFYSGEYSGDDKYQFNVDVSSEEAGLLAGIIEWVKKIWTGITEIPSKVWSAFSSAFDTIYGWFGSLVDFMVGGFSDVTTWLTDLWATVCDLPSVVWGLFESGLQALFVPEDSKIVTFKDNIDALLSDRLGAVYQVMTILSGSWDRITANDVTNTITLPKTTISLPGNNSFSFGGYEVLIVPQGFEFLATIIKTLLGVVCSVLFIDGLRKKYEEVMGVEK